MISRLFVAIDWLLYPGLVSAITHQNTRTLTVFTDANAITFSSGLSLSSRSESTSNFLIKKYRHCLESHALCSPPRPLSHSIYPSRLLDIGFGQQSLVILCSTEKLHSQDYVCLSHCWGDKKPFALNETTHDKLIAGLHLEDLPKTFQDAIMVARRLQIQYMWIDSLYAALIVDTYA